MDNMLMPYIWDLSDHIKEQIEKAEGGDMIHINEPMMPAVFQNNENVYLFAFTSEETISKEYIKEYAIVKVTIQQILLEFLAIERILGKSPLLMINPFDDENMIFAKEQLKEMLWNNKDATIIQLLKQSNDTTTPDHPCTPTLNTG